MGLLDSLKRLPIDLGQGNMRKTTKGKLIALSLIHGGDGKTALDAGCREGDQTSFLRKKGYRVTPIDIEKAMPDCIIVDLNKKLPFKDGSFDLIWCSEVIEHLDDPSDTITEFQRVLKEGGSLIITTPNSYCLIFRMIYLIFRLSPQKMQRADHKQFFDLQQMKRLFPDATIYGFFPYLIIKFRIRKLVGLLSPTFVVHHIKHSVLA